MTMKKKLFKRVHWNLTFLFTGIASLILVSLSVAYLITSEKALEENYHLSFLRESDTIFSNLEHQNTITNSWLSTITNNTGYIIAIYDNDKLLSYAETTLSENQKTMTGEVLSISRKKLPSSPEYDSKQANFYYEGKNGITYYANTARIKHPTSYLEAVILSSPQTLEKQLSGQRTHFVLIVLAGILFFFFFSFYYTGKLLEPIQESQKKQNAFIAASSHEFRTPLAVILSSVEAFHHAEPDMQEQFLQIIEKEGRRLSALVNDMLFLAKADNHTWSFSMKKTEPDTLLLNSYEEFLQIAKNNDIKLYIDLPETDIAVCVCDAERIAQVLAILLSNAISYGKKGGYIKLSICFSPSSVSFVVEDNGRGISDEAKSHIFDRFYRENSARNEQNHFGLGLCIAKEIIELHSGDITVSDTPGGGTTFTVTLPYL